MEYQPVYECNSKNNAKIFPYNTKPQSFLVALIMCGFLIEIDLIMCGIRIEIALIICGFLIERTSDTLIGYLPIFQMLPKTPLCIRYHWYSFE